MSYNKKDDVALAYDANKKRLRLEGRLVLDRMMNEAIAQMDAEFAEALNRGEVLRIDGSREELREFLRRAAEKELGSGKERHALPGKK